MSDWSRVPRREFLRPTATAGAAVAARAFAAPACRASKSPNDKLKATNCPQADRHLRREYRPRWTL